ncbi:MAG: tetratricopeptide repeat protein, partial [Thermonemataceae bacterium]
TNDRLGLAEAYGALGHIFEKTQQYDKALHYQNLALNLYEVAKDSLGLAIVHDNIGSIYEDLANYKKAKYHFEIAYQYNISKHNLIVAIINLNNLGDVHRKQKNFLAALKYTSKAYQFADEIHNDYQKRSAMRDLSKVYFALNQLDTAFHYLEESYEMTVDIFGEQTAEEVGKMKTIFEVAQKEERIARLQNEQRQERLLFIILAVAVLIFLVFGGSLYYQTIQKSKKQQKIMEIQAELSRSELENIRLNEQNLKKELENKKLLEKHLEQKLELKNKSLTTNTLQLIQKNEFLQMIRKQLNGLKKTEDKKTKQQVKRIIQAIDLKYNLEDDWAEFEHVFEQVHADFFGILQEAHPDLTPSEIRLCALIKLNLPSRNVATIMGISTNSLRMARYRLKKKLNLEKHTNLFSYLSTLVSP